MAQWDNLGDRFEWWLWNIFSSAISFGMFHQNNSMVWDISSHSGEESGRSGSLRFHQIQHRQSLGQERLRKQFMLFTESPGLLQLSRVWGCGEEGFMGLTVEHFEAIVSDVNRNDSAVNFYYSFSCPVFDFLLREFPIL